MARSKILVVRLSALGDVAMLCAILREAATLYPDREYTLLSRPRMAELLVDMPSNIHFLAWSKEQTTPSVDWQKFDIVIDAHSVLRSLRLDMEALRHGKPIRRLHKPRWGRWLLTKGLRHLPLRPMLDQYRRLLDLPAIISEKASHTDSDKYGIGIAPFAAHWGKIYPLSRMEQVIAILSQSGEPIYLFGAGDKEKAILEQWEKAYPNVTSLVGKQTMSKELQIMSGLRLMITMDSGNMHMASLAGTRVISIWGATQLSMGFAGYGQSPDDAVSLHLPCSPCSAFGNKPCRFGDYRCMHIAPETIVARI